MLTPGRAVIALGVLLASVAPATAQMCPFGTFPWTDAWGNRVCQRLGMGGPATIEGSLDRCPPGSSPWVDTWGNRVCRGFGGGGDAYDTSRGCPFGFYPWVDAWGNRICQRW